MFKKILIANRGEIACRIIKTAKKMGIATVAVYSEADRDALHVGLADEAVLLGPAPSRESYLVADKIIAACKATGAEAVHPGYGFLSENEGFARRVEEEGIVFIGPKHYSIAAMGDKIASKKLANAGQGQHHPGLERGHRDGRARGRDRARHRLPGDDQGQCRRRRQGPARRVQRQGSVRELHHLPQRGQGQLRRRPCLHREVHRAAAPHRDPGARRRARQRGLPARARVLDPAPAPEGDRGGAFALHQRRHAPGDGRAGGGAGPGRALPERGYGGVRGRQGPELLLPGDEHPAAGGAPRDREHHRHRPRRADDPRGGGREAAVHAGRDPAPRLGDRVPHQRRGPVPQLPAFDRPARALHAAAADDGSRDCRCRTAAACAWTPGSTKAARSRCTTTR